jgi:hypothetical protein
MSIQRATLADEEFKRAFIDGKLVIDCLEIKLIQNVPINPVVYTSSGYLHVSPSAGIEARLISPQLVDQMQLLMQSFETRSGEIFPESYYYTLEAKDISGNIWRNLMTQVELMPNKTCTVIGVSCDYIRCEFQEKASSATWTHMVFLDELDFPMNVFTEKHTHIRNKIQPTPRRTISSGKAGGMVLDYHNETGEVKHSELFAEADQGVNLPAGFQHRLLESVRFSTSTFASWVMNETVQNSIRTLELSSLRNANKGLIPEPLDARGHDKDFYQLLDRYFLYSLDNAKDENFAPLSSKLGGLYPLKGVWLDTIALIVVVAVESVSSEFSEIAIPDQKLIDEVDEISDPINAIDETRVRANTKERALGSVSNMKSTRAGDRLKHLAKIGVITNGEILQWQRLRNTSAHGTLHDDPTKLQKLLSDIYGAMTLLNKLVFLRIGYDGKYSNYSKIGWPVMEFKASDFKANLCQPSTSADVEYKPSSEPR